MCRFLRESKLNSGKKKIHSLEWFIKISSNRSAISAFVSSGAKWSAILCAVLRYPRTLRQRAGIMSAKLHSEGSWAPQSFKRPDLLMRNTETSLFKKLISFRMVLKITVKSAEMSDVKRDSMIPTNTLWTVSVLAALPGNQHFTVLVSKQPALALCGRCLHWQWEQKWLSF